MRYIHSINLAAFDGEAGGEAAVAQPQSVNAPDAQAQEAAAAPTEEQQAAKPSFDELVRGEYKSDFDARVQDIVRQRLKSKNAELDAARPLIAALQQRYGVDDPGKVLEALNADSAYWQAAADRAGMTVEQYQRMTQAESENRVLRERIEQEQTERRREETYAELNRQAEAVKMQYPGFDVGAELRDNQQFGELVRRGIDMLTAYQVTHQDEILAATRERVEQQTLEKVRTKQKRPAENGTGGDGGTPIARDVSKLSRNEFAELEQRVLRGERIVL